MATIASPSPATPGLAPLPLARPTAPRPDREAPWRRSPISSGDPFDDFEDDDFDDEFDDDFEEKWDDEVGDDGFGPEFQDDDVDDLDDGDTFQDDPDFDE